MKKIFFIGALSALTLGAMAQQDTTIVVSEARVVSIDTTMTMLTPDSTVIEQQLNSLKAEQEAARDTSEGWRFRTIDSVGITPVKDQHRSGTCWAFSTLGFLESEVLRMKGKEIEFAPMYVVSKTMIDRATYTVRMFQEPKFGMAVRPTMSSTAWSITASCPRPPCRASATAGRKPTPYPFSAN